MKCNHTLWLDTSDLDHGRVREMARLTDLTSQISPELCPSLVLLLESRHRHYFPSSERKGVYLRLGSEAVYPHRPILVASIQTPGSTWVRRGASHGYQCCSVTQETTLPAEVSHYAVPLLLFPFTHVLVFVYQSESDTDDIQLQLHAWQHCQQSFHPRLPMPKIVILKRDRTLTVGALRKKFAPKLNNTQSEPFVVRIDEQSYSANGLEPICTRLSPALKRSRQERAKNQMLFSVDHFKGLFSYSMATQAQSKPFNIIQASRTRNPVASNLVEHLRNLIYALPDDVDLEFVAESVASTFLFDHWTETMHSTYTDKLVSR